MSVILRMPDGGIKLLCKGAVSCRDIFEICSKSYMAILICV